VVLQICKDFHKVELCSCNETYVTPCDGNEVIGIKVEKATAIQEEKDPLLITLPVINAEHEVSCNFGACCMAHFINIPKCQMCF
jgi:hypothetical protein